MLPFICRTLPLNLYQMQFPTEKIDFVYIFYRSPFTVKINESIHLSECMTGKMGALVTIVIGFVCIL